MKFSTIINMFTLAASLCALVSFAQSFDGTLGVFIAAIMVATFLRLVWIVIIHAIHEEDIKHLEKVVSRIAAEKAELLDQVLGRKHDKDSDSLRDVEVQTRGSSCKD